MFVRLICTDKLVIKHTDSDKNNPCTSDYYDLIINTAYIWKIKKYEKYQDLSSIQEEQYSITFTHPHRLETDRLETVYIDKQQFERLLKEQIQATQKENYLDLRPVQ